MHKVEGALGTSVRSRAARLAGQRAKELADGASRQPTECLVVVRMGGLADTSVSEISRRRQ